MAYNSRKLKTLKWLEKLCNGNIARLNGVFARYGRLYAIDSFICACVEYPENARAGEHEWQVLSEFTDEKGYLLPILTFEDMETPFRSDDFFELHFPAPGNYTEWNDIAPVNANILMFALKPFKINNINPCFSFSPNQIMLSGHNHEVSIKICMMCMKK